MAREHEVYHKRKYRQTHKLGRTCDGNEFGRRCGEPIYDGNTTGRCQRHPCNIGQPVKRPPQSEPVTARRYEG